MEKDKYVAYVSTYTSGNKSSFGIKIYDVDMNKGRFVEKDQVEITNSSYVTISHNRKYLYSITDFGVEAYKILEDGSLQVLNHASINGMRGCYLSTDYEDRFLFVAGYHDAKLTVLRVEENGTIGEITDEIFHKGLGSIAERNFRPHINCVKMTRDNRFLCAADLGMDHVVVYELNHSTGKLRQVDIIRSEQVSSDMYVSIDLVEEVIERQLKKYKNKIVDKQQNAAAFTQEFVEKDYDDDEVKIIRTKRFGIKPMDPEEACVQMELLGHNFYVFFNSETEEVNVVYKRKEGGYGVLES